VAGTADVLPSAHPSPTSPVQGGQLRQRTLRRPPSDAVFIKAIFGHGVTCVGCVFREREHVISALFLEKENVAHI